MPVIGRHQPPHPRPGAAREIERVAIDEGMDTLRQAALRRVARGDLSIEEMLRIVS